MTIPCFSAPKMTNSQVFEITHSGVTSKCFLWTIGSSECMSDEGGDFTDSSRYKEQILATHAAGRLHSDLLHICRL